MHRESVMDKLKLITFIKINNTMKAI